MEISIHKSNYKFHGHGCIKYTQDKQYLVTKAENKQKIK